MLLAHALHQRLGAAWALATLRVTATFTFIQFWNCLFEAVWCPCGLRAPAVSCRAGNPALLRGCAPQTIGPWLQAMLLQCRAWEEYIPDAGYPCTQAPLAPFIPQLQCLFLLQLSSCLRMLSAFHCYLAKTHPTVRVLLYTTFLNAQITSDWVKRLIYMVCSGWIDVKYHSNITKELFIRVVMHFILVLFLFG